MYVLVYVKCKSQVLHICILFRRNTQQYILISNLRILASYKVDILAYNSANNSSFQNRTKILFAQWSIDVMHFLQLETIAQKSVCKMGY